MPAPDHLIPLLTALGNGGTVATATAVAAAAGGLPGQVPAPALDVVLAALGDGATRDVAGRVVYLYADAIPKEHIAEDAKPSIVVNVSGVVNETAEAVAATLARAIAATSPETATPVAPKPVPEPFVEYPDSDEDEWEPSGLDEFAPAAEPVVDAPVVEAASAATVRAWAKANGVTCPARGAIPAAVRDAYNAAQA